MGSYLSNVMKDSSQPSKRRRYDAAFRAEALRLARESRSAQAAARALNIRPRAALPMAAGDPSPVARRPGRSDGSAGPAHDQQTADAGTRHFKKNHCHLSNA